MNLLRSSLLTATLLFAPSMPEARGEEPSIVPMVESQDFHDALMGAMEDVAEDDKPSRKEIRHRKKIQRQADRQWERNWEEANKPTFEKIHFEEAFFERYEIEVFKTIESTETEGDYYKLVPYHGTQRALERDMLGLKAQLAKWPPEIFKKLGLKELIWSEYMDDGDGRIAGVMPFRGRVFYLAKSWPLSHEIFHRIDYLTGGGDSFGRMPEDEAEYWIWDAKNRQASKRNNPQWYSLDHPSAVDPSRVNENQAEYARMLMNLEDPRVLYHQYLPLMEYPGPRDKFVLMRQWLLEFSGGLLNDQFFVDLQAGRVDEHYWQKRLGDEK
ncbi:MAG: hypothetical protein WCW30_04870 [Candidatus Gracilibacteria bacterium]